MSAWKAGKVQWFDEETGKGMIVDLADGTPYYVNYTSIQSKKKWRSLNEGVAIKYTLKADSEFDYVEKIKEV